MLFQGLSPFSKPALNLSTGLLRTPFVWLFCSLATKDQLVMDSDIRLTADKSSEKEMDKSNDRHWVWTASGWRVLDWCTGSSPLPWISLFKLSDEISARGLKRHDEIFCKKMVGTEKMRWWFNESFYSGATGTPPAGERNMSEHNGAPLLYLTTQLVFDYLCEPAVESDSASARRCLSSPTWSGSVLCVSFANVCSLLGLFLRCCSDIKAASGGIQPR